MFGVITKLADLAKRNRMQLLLCGICLTLTSIVIGNAYQQKKQFYPAVVYITKSNSSMGVIYAQFFVIVFLLGKIFRKIFLGTLRPAEFEHLLDRFWYALTETCLAFTVFRDDFNPRFVALFTLLLFLKSFHWLAEERVDFMERSPVLGALFHIRVISLLTILTFIDYVLLSYAIDATMEHGATVQLVFGFEYAILLTVVASTIVKYALHTAEMRTQNPWENKAMFLLYTELVIGFVKVIFYLLFVIIMAKIYALPMFVLRPMFFTVRNFRKALNDVIMSRRAIRNMNTLYPEATELELQQSDNICIICRDDMVSHAKKLPCGHIFHTLCLRSWFQRQQTCPTCRMNILRVAALRPAVAAAAQPATAIEGRQTTAGVATENAGVQRAQGVPDLLPNAAQFFANTGGNVFPTPNNYAAMPILPPFVAPQFPLMLPFNMPPPPAIPANLTELTDEELRVMEENNRKAIEERLKLLKNIQALLDAASTLMINYQIVTAHAPAPPIVPAATTNSDDVPSTSRPNLAAPEIATPANSSVVIEDLGSEEDQHDEHTSEQAGSEQTCSSSSSPEDSNLNELRQRRLKFWEEQKKIKATLKITSDKATGSSSSSGGKNVN